ncbi:Ig-like domain-containing protein, partial [Scandinavium sp. M-37]|uniref:Ig-like domain-containing protein n=1 Tax=Scandinavium sp. M-37 TaxID=3373077 RepID=UPI003745C282
LPVENGQLVPTPAEPGVINIDTISDNQGVHTGTVNNFGFTDDLTPTLSGNADPRGAGTIIQFCINTELVGSARISADGSWSFTPEKPLEANHEYIFQSIVQDGGSKQFLISLPYTITTTDLNGDIPATASLDSVVDNVSDYNGAVGPLKDGGLTNDARPELSGHATAGATVNIYDNGVLLDTTTAKADGSWTYTPTKALTDGTHNLAVSAVNATGESKQVTFTIGVDTLTTKPVVDSATDDQGAMTGNLAGGGLTDDSRPVLHGYAEPNSRVDIHVFGPNGQELYYDSVTSSADGTWDYQTRAFTTQGTYSFGISAIDQAGNAWRDYGTKFTLKYVGSNQDDTTAPEAATSLVLNDNVGSIKGAIHDQGLTDDNTPTLTGKAEAGTTVVVSDNGLELGTAIVKADGSWTLTPYPPLNDGQHSITTVVKDAAGQSSTVSEPITFTVDTHTDAPVISGYLDDVGVSTGTVEYGGRTDDKDGVLSGHAEPGSTIRLTLWGPRGVQYRNVAHTVTDSDGNWHIQLSDGTRLLGTQGNWTFRVTAT